ncbi:alpha/beta hydrolase [Pseudomonas sp. MM211]|uniref:alpha/beta hydrolase n=1 Tax=Pseudomonas sp. MM211 TaxID=2866808 RepID=UPI003FA73DAD
MASRVRSAALLVGVALTVALSGCQSPLQRLDELAGEQGQRVQTLDLKPFPLLLSAPNNAVSASRIRVYLEGDGQAWATPSQPSLDPSPRDLLVARLAFADPTPSLYLARPCQFVRSDACETALWTNRRFGNEVLASLDGALDLIKTRYGNRDFELVGYSGGAALALLLAARRDDVASVQTLAGNLSPRYWVQLQQLSPLDGSLEPLDYRQRLALIAQRHLVGDEDRVVPADVLGHYLDGLGEARCMEAVSLPHVSHRDGWEAAWAQWRQQPLKCAE